MERKEGIKNLAKEAMEHYNKYCSLISEIREKLFEEGSIVLPQESRYSYSCENGTNRNLFPKEIYCENEECKTRWGCGCKKVLKFKDGIGDVHSEDSIEKPYEPNREFIEMLANVL